MIIVRFKICICLLEFILQSVNIVSLFFYQDCLVGGCNAADISIILLRKKQVYVFLKTLPLFKNTLLP